MDASDFFPAVAGAFEAAVSPHSKLAKKDWARVVGKSLPGGWGYTTADARLMLLGRVVEETLHHHPTLRAYYSKVHSDEGMADTIGPLALVDAAQQIVWATQKANFARVGLAFSETNKFHRGERLCCKLNGELAATPRVRANFTRELAQS